MTIDINQKNVVLISEDLVAKVNHTCISEPEKQMVMAEVNTGSEEGGALTDAVKLGPSQSCKSRSGEVKRNVGTYGQK